MFQEISETTASHSASQRFLFYFCSTLVIFN